MERESIYCIYGESAVGVWNLTTGEFQQKWKPTNRRLIHLMQQDMTYVMYV